MYVELEKKNISTFEDYFAAEHPILKLPLHTKKELSQEESDFKDSLLTTKTSVLTREYVKYYENSLTLKKSKWVLIVTLVVLVVGHLFLLSMPPLGLPFYAISSISIAFFFYQLRKVYLLYTEEKWKKEIIGDILLERGLTQVFLRPIVVNQKPLEIAPLLPAREIAPLPVPATVEEAEQEQKEMEDFDAFFKQEINKCRYRPSV